MEPDCVNFYCDRCKQGDRRTDRQTDRQAATETGDKQALLLFCSSIFLKTSRLTQIVEIPPKDLDFVKKQSV